MKAPEIPKNETERIKALQEYSILDTLAEKDFDDITNLASQICGTAISTITLIDYDRQWFKSKLGLTDRETPREYSFCAHAINKPNEIFMVQDSRNDTRFADNPLVTGDPHVIFYAGVPLVNADGYALGTICVIDNKPGNLNESQINALRILANQVMKLLELRKKNMLLEERRLVLERTLDMFAQMSRVARVGGWEADLQANKVSWTFLTKEIHEVEPDFKPDLQTAINFYKEGASRNIITNCIQKAIETGKSFDEELQIITAKGNERWVRAKGAAQFENGKCIRIYGIFQDIHAEKIKDIQLSQSEERFRQTFNYATTGIALLSPDYKWVKVNKSFCNMFGYTEEQLEHMSIQQLTHPDDIERDLIYLQRLVNNEIESCQYEKRYIHKEGHTVWCIVSRSVIRDEQHKPLHFVTQVVDITPRIKAEQEIAEERKLLATIIDNIPVNIFIKDLQSRKILVNQKEIDYSGFQNETDILGKNDYELYPETTASVSIEEDKEIFKSGLPMIDKETYSVKHDGSEHWFLTSKIPLRNFENEITSLLGISYEITERKNNEKKMKELLNVTNEQNTRLLNFAHIVSHNLISKTTNFSLLLELLETEEDEDLKKQAVALLKDASDNLTETVKELNEIVSVNTSINKETRLINLHTEIENIRNNIQALLQKENVACINNVDKNMNIYAVPAYLDSVLLNFFTNAIKYSSPQKESYIQLDAIKKNGYIILTIEDNGLGIDMQKHGEKLFGMYKTFHGNKDARGIGLYITKMQIESMGGSIDVTSQVGVGTTFSIYFPEKK